MADDSTPEGTGEQNDVDARLDRYFGVSDEEDTQEVEAAEDDEALTEEEDADTDETVEETAEDDADAEEPDQSEDVEAGRFVADDGKVRLPDGTVTTVAELKRGGLRESDYTRKTQEIAAHRKELDDRVAALTQHEQSINFAIELAKQYMPAEPDAEMLQNDPIGYLQAKHDYDSRVQQLRGLFEAKEKNDALLRQQQEQAARERMQEGAKALVEAIPELKSPDRRQKFVSDLSNAITRYGFDASDLNMVKDHRLFLLARDAMAYQKLMANKPKAMEKAKGKPPLAPGRRQSPTAEKQRDRQKDWQKLRQSNGRDGDALDRILDDLI